MTNLQLEEKQLSNELNMEDQVSKINQFIAAHKSLKFEYIDGLSFLMYAIAMMEDELAIHILRHGVDYDINESWDSGQTPLHCACQMEEADVIKVMLQTNRDTLNLYALTNDFLLHFTRWECGGKSVLHYAAIQNSQEICRLLLDFEYTHILQQQSIPKLLLMKDFQGNDAIDTALIYSHLECAKWLYLERQKYARKHSPNTNNNETCTHEEDVDTYLKQRMEAFLSNKKMLTDSRETKSRFERGINLNVDSTLIDDKDIFTLKQVWSEQECEYVLNALIEYGEKTNWKSNRYQSFATTDIPLSMMDDAFIRFIRKELYYKVYPQIVKHYKSLENRYEIGAKYLFFVRYNDMTEYRATYDNFKQNSLNLHRDGSLISFNILLNKKSDFEGGGTYIQNIDRVIEIERGDCCVHPGNILHCGNGIVRGKRYVLVGFLNAKKIHQSAQIKNSANHESSK